MQFLCIGVNDCADQIVEHLEIELQQLKNKKICYSIDKIDSEGCESIVCSIDDDRIFGINSEKSLDALRIHVSNALTDYIIMQYEEKLLSRIINSNYCYFTNTEKKDIIEVATRMIKNEDNNIFNSLFQIRRKNIILRKLLEYFETSNNIILDGFVNFRLKDYIKDLEEIVDKAVDEFLMEREYKEFIRLLRYFVDIQEPRFETIHVIVGFDNKYILMDNTGREITNECIHEFVNELNENEINYDDLLVSSLITLAPKNIVIHLSVQFKNKELLETIKNVFFGRVTICKGCDICTTISALKKSKE